MYKIISLLFFAFMAFGTFVFGQADSLTIQLELGIRGRWQTGNLNQLVLNPTAKIQFSKKSFQTELLADYQFLKVEGFVAIKDLWINGIHKHRPQWTIFPMATSLYGFAKSYKIDHSFLIGTGVGVNLFNKSVHNFLQVHIFAGYMDFQFEGINPHSSATYGSIVQTNIPIGPHINLSWNLQTFHSAKDQSFWGINSGLSFFFQVTKNLSLTANHKIIYNNKTITDIEHTNTLMLFGMRYLFNNH